LRFFGAFDNKRYWDSFKRVVVKFVHHRQLELGSFVLLDPEAQHIFGSITLDAQAKVTRFVLN